MKRIKILHLIKSLGRGGAETLLPETLKLHDKDRFEFHYIYFLPWKDQMVESLERNGGRVTCLQASGNLQMLLKYRHVATYCSENKIRLIHCHLPWAGMVGRLVFRATGIPVLYTEHNKQERYHYLTRMMNRLTFNLQTRAIAVSEDVAQSIRNNIDPEIPITTILNGVNTSFFKRDPAVGAMLKEKLNIPGDSIIIGTIAVFRFQKRLKEWLEVFKRVSRENNKLYGIIVGDGPLKREILNHRNELGLESRVLMPGLQTEVKPWLSAMDIFMMTSEFEGLPVALLEAMSMECAVAATDAGGIREVIRHNENGLMVPVAEWIKLNVELANLINDKDKQGRLVAAARKSVEESYGIERMVKELEKLYVNS